MGEAPAGYEDPEELKTSDVSGGDAPPGYEDADEPPRPEKPPGILARVGAAIPSAGSMHDPYAPKGYEAVAPEAPALPTPLQTNRPSIYAPPKPAGDQMFETTIPNEPVVSNLEDVWKHAPGPPGPLLSPEAKAGLAAQPKNVSMFAGQPAGQPVTTSGPGLVGGLQQSVQAVTGPLAAAAETARQGLAPGVEMAQDIGKQVAGPLGPQAAQTVGAATGQAAEIIGQMATDPAQIAILAGMGELPGPVGHALLSVFMAQGTKGAADDVTDLTQNWSQYTPDERGKRLGSAAANALMVLGPAAGMARGAVGAKAAEIRAGRPQWDQERTQALDTLGLPENASPEQVRAQGREAVLANHPDRGGDVDAFRRTMAAWDYVRDTPPNQVPKRPWQEQLDDFLKAPIATVKRAFVERDAQPIPEPAPKAPMGALPPGTAAEAPAAELPAPERAAPPPEPVSAVVEAPEPPPEPVPDKIAARADELQAQFQEESHAKKGPLLDQARLRKEPPTREEFEEAAEQEIQDEKAAVSERNPDEGTPQAAGLGRPADQVHGEAVNAGGGIPEHGAAPEDAGAAERPAGGRGERGAEVSGELTDEAVAAERKLIDAERTTFLDKENGIESRVVQTRDGRFSVTLRDIDADEVLPVARIFNTREAAEAQAKKVIGDGRVEWRKGRSDSLTGEAGGAERRLAEAKAWAGRGGREEFDQAAYRKQKTGLTRALNAKDWKAVLANVEAFDKHWEGRSPPDDWARWERAKEDAQYELAREPKTYGMTPGNLGPSQRLTIHQEARRKFDEAFAANDVPKLHEYLDLKNPGLRSLFEARTGLTLPKMTGRRLGVLKSWASHRVNAPEKPMASPPPEGYIQEGEQNAAPREPAQPVGTHGPRAVEEGRAEALRGAEGERETPSGLTHGAAAGEGPVRQNGPAGEQPTRGAEGSAEQPPEVRPGERPGEGAALGGGRGPGQLGAGNEETPLASGTERPKGPAEPGRPEVPEGEGTLESHPTASNAGTDFRYDSAAHAEGAAAGGARSRVAANIEALRTLEAVKAERRPATAAEQAALAKFSGWGSFPGLFRYGSDLEDQGDIVRKLIGEGAWEAARASTLNAHYTAPQIVSAMWDAARRLGLKGGRILEPSLGIGNFFALMPPEVRGRSQLTGVELDTSTGEMAKLLYPNANVEVKGFQDLKVPDGFYDFAISNVPFGDYRVHDKEYNKYPANIHDYFFLKSLDKVRPGGVVAFITSTGTMDKSATRVRGAMIEKGADLVAAIRLPAETFQKTAGTSVVTDIIFLKKRAPGEPPSGPEWTKTVEFPDPDGKAPIPLNEYFAANPQQVLGRLDRSGTMYRGEQVNVKRLPDFEEKFRAAIERLPEKIIEPRKASSAFDPKLVQSAGNAKYGSSVVQNGKLYVSLGDVMREVSADPATVARVEKMLAIRDQVRDLYDAQLSDKGETAIQDARQKLGKVYDAFVQKHGPISAPKNLDPIADDPDTPYILQSLERIDPKTKKVTKTDIFTKDTVASYKKAEHAASAGDAVSISLRERGNLDIEQMAKLLGRSEAEVGKDLVSEGLAYDDPKDGWTAKSLYLSGNVRRKLLEAKAAAKVDPRYAANLEPLEQAQPKDLDFTEIYAPVGAPWITEADHVDFMQHLIGGAPHDFKADFDPTQGHWFFRYTDRGKRHQGLAPDTKLWGTDRLGFMKLMESAANGQHPAVREPHPTEEGKTVVNVEATAAANQKVDDIKRAFEDWVWDDPERRTRLHRYYNDNFNNLKRTDYDASHYKDAEGNYHFPGMNPAISLRPHQANFVWQAVSTGRGLAGHEVGTGKTMVEAAIAMEWRRLGLSRKPIITVPDSVVAGFADEFRRLYPAARIIVTGSGLDAKERKETLARAASGDWDAVLMTHDNLDKLTMRPEVTQAYIEEQLDDLRAVKMAAHEKDPKKDNRIVKALAKAELRLEAKLKDLIEGKTEKDRALYFEELGGDSLIVDEAHVYKSLPVYTAMENLKGVPGQESQRATNMLMRTRWLQQQNGGRGVIFATGTPIDNSLAELYNMQRYLQFNELKERGIQSFDAWARTFATEQSQMEMKATGDYAMETRLSSFVNVPDLQALSGVVTDVKRATDMGDIIRPHRTDELVTVPMSDLGRQYLDVLRRRAEAIRKRGRLEKGEHGDTFLAITNDAAEAATDIRRVAPGAPDEPGSKVNALVRKVLEIHKENPGKTQLIFSDRGVHETARGGHSTYKDIIRKLVKGGIPAAKIVNFSDLGKGGKEEAVARVKSGDALVAIGGSKTLGTGVNVQDKLIAVHHLDCPWTPARLEQRNGRIWRQGNENTHIRIIPYVTEGSFDANMWEAVNRKSKFIAQFMDGKFKGRSFEDPDAEKLSYAQIMAKASGSPELLEKINLEEQVKKLERAKRQHKKVQAELQDSLKNSANMADYHRKRIATWEAAAQRLATPRGKFSVEVGGKVYDEQKAAGEAMAPILAEADKAATWGRDEMAPIPLAVYRGEPVEMRSWGAGSVAPFAFDGTKTLSMEAGNPSSILNSFDGIARSLPAYVAQEKASLAAIEQAAEKAKAEIGKPFRDEEKLLAGQKRLPELEQIVKQKMEAAKKAREGQAVDPLLADAISKSMVPPETPEAAGGEKALNPKAFYIYSPADGYTEVKGRKLDFPEEPDHGFFLHKDSDGVWLVSEARTGLSLGVRSYTQLNATAAARKMLASSAGKLDAAIAKHVEKHGPSPRFPAEYKAFQEAHPAEVETEEPEPMVKGDDGVYREPEKTGTHEFALFSARPKAVEETETERELPGPWGGGPRRVPPALPKEPKIVAPPFPEAKLARVGKIELRATLGELARRHDVEAKALEEWDRYFDAPSRREPSAEIESIAQEWEDAGRKDEAKALRDHTEQVDFMQRMDSGRTQPTLALEGLARHLKKAQDARKDELIGLGMDAAKNWREAYFPHIWEQKKDEKGPSMIAKMLGRRPLEGSKSFTKQRVFPEVMDGIRAGYVPVDWNPIRLTLLKNTEQDRCITAWKGLESLHELKVPVYVPVRTKMPEGYRVPKDAAFAVYKSPMIDVKEAFDPKLMKGLEEIGDALGTHVATKMSLGRGKAGSRWGIASEQGDEVLRRFGGPEEILAHELGHAMDTKIGLLKRLREGDEKTVDKELGRLAGLRTEGMDEDDPKADAYRKYVHRPDEQVANLIHAVVNIPDMVKEYAPETWKRLQKIGETEPAVKKLLGIQRSVLVEERTGQVNVGGVVQAGSWALPSPIADVLDTHLTPSLLSGSKAFQGYRKASQALLMARLGWSGFHLGFTTGDVTLSRLSLAGTYALQGDVEGVGKALGSIPQALAGWVKDNPALKEWYAPGTQGEDMGAIIKALEMGGARARQGNAYNLGAWEEFFRDLRKAGVGVEGGALRRGADVAAHPGAVAAEVARHPARSLAALIEGGSRYVLNNIVPRQKFAIAAQLAERDLRVFMKETGASSLKEALEATDPLRVKDAMAKNWDTVDDRMGQLVYDNLFINRTVRDCLHASFQSVGWNWGSVRHLGGGVKDAAKLIGRGFKPEEDVRGHALPRVSDRLAYSIALPFFAAFIGAMIQKAYTGENPKDARDLQWPRNGRLNPDGTPQRLAPATYMKDVAAYLGGFLGANGGVERGVRQAATTVQHKMNPLLSMLAEAWRNEDFYGTEVRHKDDPPAQQLLDLAKFAVGGFTPYSFQGLKKEMKSGASLLEASPAMFGLPPAAAQVSRDPLHQALIEYQREHRMTGARTKQQAEKSDLRRTIIGAKSRGDEETLHDAEQQAREGGFFTPKQLRKLGKKGPDESTIQGFRGLPLPEAIRIYKLGDEAEQKLLAPSLRKKIQSKAGLDAVPLQKRVDYLREARGLVEANR
jgi:N12 class adenine-specific DNA methylase